MNKKKRKKPAKLLEPIPNKLRLIFAIAALVIALIPIIANRYTLSFELVAWVLIVIVGVDALLVVFVFNWYIEYENSKYRDFYSQGEKRCKAKLITAEKDRDTAKNNLATLEQQSTAEKEKLKIEKKKLEPYRDRLKELYVVQSAISSTNEYSTLCFKYGVLNLFDPIRFRFDSNYSSMINTYSDELVGFFKTEKTPELAGYEIRNKLEELEKKYKKKGSNGDAPILSRDSRARQRTNDEKKGDDPR